MPSTDSDPGSITRVQGIEVGHHTDARRPTGCTVVLARGGAVGGCDVRGAAPGTRETDLLHPSNLVQQVHAVMLSGGSAWGLDAASGAMRWLEEQGIGLEDRKSTRLNSSHLVISYAVFCLKKKNEMSRAASPT